MDPECRYIRLNSFYPSADGEHNIFYTMFIPDGEVKGVVQIAHGMCEYFERYTEFAAYLCEHGYAVCGNDHLGHGGSVNDASEYGYFSEENGWQNAVEDMYALTKLAKERFSDKPYILLGHSMGSFLARAYVTRHGSMLDAAVFCGTKGEMKGIPALLAVIEMMKSVFSDNFHSRLLDKLAFGLYNAKIKPHRTRYDWLSRDEKIVDKYAKDDKCTFIFSLNGFENLMKVLWYVSDDKWFETYPKDLPTYLIAGSADPVGNYGKGVLSVFNRLFVQNCDVEMKIYRGARHELLNETNKQEVYEDVLSFIESVVNDGNEDDI